MRLAAQVARQGDGTTAQVFPPQLSRWRLVSAHALFANASLSQCFVYLVLRDGAGNVLLRLGPEAAVAGSGNQYLETALGIGEGTSGIVMRFGLPPDLWVEEGWSLCWEGGTDAGSSWSDMGFVFERPSPKPWFLPK